VIVFDGGEPVRLGTGKKEPREQGARKLASRRGGYRPSAKECRLHMVLGGPPVQTLGNDSSTEAN